MKRLLFAGALLAACSLGPDPIREGTDVCFHCGMLISDARYAAEALVGTRALKFDSLDELRAESPSGARPYVTDFPTRRLLPGAGSFILVSPGIRAPMGGTAIAFADSGSAVSFARDHHLAPFTIQAFEKWYAR